MTSFSRFPQIANFETEINSSFYFYCLICITVIWLEGVPDGDPDDLDKWEMSIEDPYFVVRDEVSSAVSNCSTKLLEWRHLMEAQTPNGSRARELTSELRSNVRSAEWDLEDLEESVS